METQIYLKVYSATGVVRKSDVVFVAYGREKEIVKNEDDLLRLDNDFLNCLIY